MKQNELPVGHQQEPVTELCVKTEMSAFVLIEDRLRSEGMGQRGVKWVNFTDDEKRYLVWSRELAY